MLIQLLEELHKKQNQEVKLQEELEALKDSLRSEKQNLAEVECDRDRLKSLCAERDAALQVSVIKSEAHVLSLITMSILLMLSFEF
jgi:pheromone shutdown protein TraB